MCVDCWVCGWWFGVNSLIGLLVVFDWYRCVGCYWLGLVDVGRFVFWLDRIVWWIVGGCCVLVDCVGCLWNCVVGCWWGCIFLVVFWKILVVWCWEWWCRLLCRFCLIVIWFCLWFCWDWWYGWWLYCYCNWYRWFVFGLRWLGNCRGFFYFVVGFWLWCGIVGVCILYRRCGVVFCWGCGIDWVGMFWC